MEIQQEIVKSSHRLNNDFAISAAIFFFITALMIVIKDVSLIHFDLRYQLTADISGHIESLFAQLLMVALGVLALVLKNKSYKFFAIFGILIAVIGYEDLLTNFSHLLSNIPLFFWDGILAWSELGFAACIIVYAFFKKKAAAITAYVMLGINFLAVYASPNEWSAVHREFVEGLLSSHSPLFLSNLITFFHPLFWVMSCLFIALFIFTTNEKKEKP